MRANLVALVKNSVSVGAATWSSNTKESNAFAPGSVTSWAEGEQLCSVASVDQRFLDYVIADCPSCTVNTEFSSYDAALGSASCTVVFGDDVMLGLSVGQNSGVTLTQRTILKYNYRVLSRILWETSNCRVRFLTPG